jgi:hypothetical protein
MLEPTQDEQEIIQRIAALDIGKATLLSAGQHRECAGRSMGTNAQEDEIESQQVEASETTWFTHHRCCRRSLLRIGARPVERLRAQRLALGTGDTAIPCDHPGYSRTDRL